MSFEAIAIFTSIQNLDLIKTWPLLAIFWHFFCQFMLKDDYSLCKSIDFYDDLEFIINIKKLRTVKIHKNPVAL